MSFAAWKGRPEAMPTPCRESPDAASPRLIYAPRAGGGQLSPAQPCSSLCGSCAQTIGRTNKQAAPLPRDAAAAAALPPPCSMCGPGDASFVAATCHTAARAQVKDAGAEPCPAPSCVPGFCCGCSSPRGKGGFARNSATHGWKGGRDGPHEAPAIAPALAGGKGCQARQKAPQTQERVASTL